VADVAWTTNTTVPSNHHALVPRGAKNNFPQGDVAEEDAVLPALWSRIPGLVRLPAAGGIHMCLAVSSQPIQDHRL